VPNDVKGELTAVMTFNTDPFPVKLKPTRFTIP
jgi:hypothetical protein